MSQQQKKLQQLNNQTPSTLISEQQGNISSYNQVFKQFLQDKEQSSSLLSVVQSSNKSQLQSQAEKSEKQNQVEELYSFSSSKKSEVKSINLEIKPNTSNYHESLVVEDISQHSSKRDKHDKRFEGSSFQEGSFIQQAMSDNSSSKVNDGSLDRSSQRTTKSVGINQYQNQNFYNNSSNSSQNSSQKQEKLLMMKPDDSRSKQLNIQKISNQSSGSSSSSSDKISNIQNQSKSSYSRSSDSSYQPQSQVAIKNQQKEASPQIKSQIKGPPMKQMIKSVQIVLKEPKIAIQTISTQQNNIKPNKTSSVFSKKPKEEPVVFNSSSSQGVFQAHQQHKRLKQQQFRAQQAKREPVVVNSSQGVFVTHEQLKRLRQAEKILKKNQHLYRAQQEKLKMLIDQKKALTQAEMNNPINESVMPYDKLRFLYLKQKQKKDKFKTQLRALYSIYYPDKKWEQKQKRVHKI